LGHTLLDTMVDTRSISNDQGRTRICLCLCQSFHSLVEVSAHGDLSNIYIAIAHGDRSHVFLLHFFTACCELSDRTGRRSLGGLSASIGVNLCIEYHNVDVASACENMVNAAESDIVSPSVTAEDPLGFLGQEIFLLKNLFASFASACLKSCYKFICSRAVGGAYGEGIQPFLAGCLNILFICGCYKGFYFFFQTVTDRFLCEKHTVSELCVILE